MSQKTTFTRASRRALIPSLLAAFPLLSFVVATHSPFIVTAVPESAVYVLDYEDNAVVSRLLDTVSKAAPRMKLSAECSVLIQLRLFGSRRQSTTSWPDFRTKRSALETFVVLG